MIFATVGTQLPFPRLMSALDRIAGEHALDIVAQTGDPAFAARNLKAHAYFSPTEFDAACSSASLIVGHAGMGTIFAAKRYMKSLVLFPRRASLGEHRNEHQLATADQMEGTRGLYIARDLAQLESLICCSDLEPMTPELGEKHVPLIARLSAFIAAP